MKKIIGCFIGLFCLSLIGALANKTSVEIKVSEAVKAGTEVTITINVKHSGNSKAHHTDWVYLKINGKEVQRWVYTRDALPLTENFTVEYKFVPTESFTIEAEGHCCIHGTAGEKSASVKVTT
jgi:desulfoferrodoxin (superoxide reductase-like protein)